MLQFLKSHASAAWTLVVGPLIAVGTRLNDAYTLYNVGLPSVVWETIGLSIFFCGVVVLLFRFSKERTVASVAEQRIERPESERLQQNPKIDVPLPVATPIAPEPERRRYYSATEKEELATAMYEVSLVLNRDGLPGAREAAAIADLSAAPSPENLKNLVQRANGIMTRIIAVEKEIWGKIFAVKSDPIFDLQHVVDCNHHEIHSVVIHFKRATQQYIDGLQTLQSLYDSVDQEGREKITALFRRANSPPLREAASLFINWIQATFARINNKKEELGR